MISANTLFSDPKAALMSVTRYLRLALIVAALSTAGWAQGAAAAVRVTFYSHGWGMTPLGQVIYPHSFIRVQGNPYGGPDFDMTYGFAAMGPSQALGGHPGLIIQTRGRYFAESRANFWVDVSDEQLKAITDRIQWWSVPGTQNYDYKNRTCIDFVADIMTLLDIEPGNARTWDPQVFMDDTLRRNPGRLHLPETAQPPSKDAKPPADLPKS